KGSEAIAGAKFDRLEELFDRRQQVRSALSRSPVEIDVRIAPEKSQGGQRSASGCRLGADPRRQDARLDRGHADPEHGRLARRRAEVRRGEELRIRASAAADWAR